MYAILVAGDRIKPQEKAPTDEERIKLHKSMMAYAGTYTIDGGKVVHHVDISWNGARRQNSCLGKSQVATRSQFASR